MPVETRVQAAKKGEQVKHDGYVRTNGRKTQEWKQWMRKWMQETKKWTKKWTQEWKEWAQKWKK